MRKFWGYVDSAGNVNVRLYVSSRQLEFAKSDYIPFIIKPFEAEDADQAEDMIRKLMHRNSG